MKKILIPIIVALMMCVFAEVPAYASSPLITQGESYLQMQPPEYEKAAQAFRRAGNEGDGEGFYRLGLMYEKGLLIDGNPCTDDIEALGKQKAEEYYALAAQNGYAPTWKSISQDEAKKLMTGDHVLVDVRRQEEYDAGHIPGAILIPNESIVDGMPEQLPDKDQLILIYCRSGNRSKQAAQKLAEMGYMNVYEFGGIETWDGGIEMKAPTRTVSEETDWDMSISTQITEDILTIFDKATEGLVGVNYTPVAVLGEKDGTFCILCKATVVFPNAKPYNVLMYVNETGLLNIYELWIDKHAEEEATDDGTSNCA